MLRLALLGRRWSTDADPGSILDTVAHVIFLSNAAVDITNEITDLFSCGMWVREAVISIPSDVDV